MYAQTVKTNLRMVLADDHPLVRAGIHATLESRDGYQIVGEAGDGEAAYQLVLTLRPDLLILDLEMDGPPPRDLVINCRQAVPHLKVLILSAHTEAHYVSPLRGLGLAGFVLKDEAPDNLLQALRVIGQGETWFSHAVTQQVLALSQRDNEQRAVRLTPREQQVLELMRLGKTNLAIATELSVTQQSVRRYATVIYEKLGVESRIQAIMGQQNK